MEFYLNVLVDGICTGARYAILGMGFALIFNTQRAFDLSYGGIYTWCGFALWILVSKAGIDLISAFVITLCFAFFLSYLIQKTYMAQMRSRSASSVSILLGSLAILMGMEAILAIFWGGAIRVGRMGEAGILKWGIIRITDINFATVLFAISIFVFINYVFMKTSIGVEARAIASNQLLSRIVGLEAEKIITLTTCLGCTIVAIDAVFVCASTGVYPVIGFNSVLIAFMAVVLGGIGSFKGAAIGGAIIGFIRTIMVVKFPTLWQELILFVILFLFIAFRPSGILGIKDWKSEV